MNTIAKHSMKRVASTTIGVAMAAAGLTVATPRADAAAIAGGWYHTMAIRNDGAIAAFGYNAYGQTSVPGISGVVDVAAGDMHSVALLSNGFVVAWGRNDYGQSNVPAGLSSVIAISASGGAEFTLALKSNGSVAAWGYNGWGQTNVPAGLSNITAVSTGARHSLALKSDATIAAWGDYSAGQLNVPAGLNSVVSIAGGGLHSLALRSNGTVAAWGGNFYGQTAVPAGLANVVSIAAGGYHNLALKTDGTIAAWGLNNWGQTVPPAGLSNVVAVAAGGGDSIALRNDGSVVAWGEYQYGQTTVPSGVFGGSTATWTRSGGGNFLASYGWKYGTPSTAVSNAVFDAAGTYAVAFTTDARAKSISINQGNVTFDLAGARTYKSESSTTINAGASLSVSGGTLQSPTITNHGTLAGAGTITGNVTSDGIIVPGNSPGTLSIAGSFAQASTGILQIDLASDTSFDRLTLGSVPAILESATLAGQLQIVLDASYSPADGMFWDILTADQLDTTGLTLVAPSGFSFAEVAGSDDDGDGLGRALRLSFATVPEPSSMLMLGLGALGALRRRKHRTH